MYLKRNIYDRMLEWKSDRSHSTLEISGARQAGKTYIVNKFADENFKHKIYVNLFDLSGKQFMALFENRDPEGGDGEHKGEEMEIEIEKKEEIEE